MWLNNDHFAVEPIQIFFSSNYWNCIDWKVCINKLCVVAWIYVVYLGFEGPPWKEDWPESHSELFESLPSELAPIVE